MGEFIQIRQAHPAAHAEIYEYLRPVAVKTACRAEFDADPVAWLWNDRDEDKAMEKAWLDANAPGWSIDVVRGQHHQLESADGEPVEYLDYQISLIFASAAHQDAWHARNDAMEDEASALYFRITAQANAAPDGTTICLDCGGFMTQTEATKTIRIGQFAFTCTAPEFVCADCGCCEFDCPGDAFMDAVCNLATLRVGLPQAGSPLWTPAIGAEWDRRIDAVPEIEVPVHVGMTVEAVIAALDEALARQGRIFGWRPRLITT
jgi:hypothetical protein